ncbi:MAG: AAA domain-containing protein [Bacilli bacterium]
MRILINDVERSRDIYRYVFNNKLKKWEVQFNGNNSDKIYRYSSQKFIIEPINVEEISVETFIKVKGKKQDNISSLVYIGDEDVQIGDNIYKKKDVQVYYYDKVDLDENIIIYDNVKNTVMDVNELLQSNIDYKIKFNNSDEFYTYPKHKIELKNRFNSRFSNLMEYYTVIAKKKDLALSKDKTMSLLQREIKKIEIIEGHSLSSYFDKTLIEYEVNNIIFPFDTNLSQMEAIENALTSNLSLVQGPPGTGKTQSILNIIANLVINNKSVAIVSNNNEATRNIKEKLDEQGFGFLSAMLGNANNKKYFFENQEDYPSDLKTWGRTDEKQKSLLTAINKNREKAKKLLVEKNDLQLYKQDLIDIEYEFGLFSKYNSENDIKPLIYFKRLGFDDTKIFDLIDTLGDDNKSFDTLIKRIKMFFNFGIYDFKQFNDRTKVINWLKKKYYINKVNFLKTEIQRIENNLLLSNLDNILYLLKNDSKEYFRSQLYMRFERDINKERKKYNDKAISKKEFSNFVKDYPLILSSTHSISTSKSKGYIFDYLIVDEASQVELVPGIISLSCSRNAVIVGDEKQLVHIPEKSISKDEYKLLAKTYMVSNEYDYYDQNLLSSFNSIFGNNIPSVLLKEHYRCHEKIIGFCNKKYYDNQLICYTKCDEKHPLILLKTVPGGHMRYKDNVDKGLYNKRELESLVDEEFLNDTKINFSNNDTYGFIAPFRDQVNFAENVLQSDVKKDTVHKFQGREVDTMIFSTVLDKKKESYNRLAFVNDENLVNVAVSRAKNKLIVVSSVDIFREETGDIGDLINYIEYYFKEDILQSEVKSIFDLLYSDYAKELEKKKLKQGWKQSDYDSENLTYELLDDILREKEYMSYTYAREVGLNDIFLDLSKLNSNETQYLKNNARVDILIYNKFNKQPVLGIEIDGFEFHENNSKQLVKDKMKTSIFCKYSLPLLRLKTNGSKEREKIIEFL